MEIYNGTYCVYIHINKINGKIYVGQTNNGSNPQKRWNSGKGYMGSRYFWSAIQKYGWDNFEHVVVANNLTSQEADGFEKLLIKKLDTTNRNKGYNLESGGKKNKILSKTTRKAISENAKERYKNPENHPMFGKCHSEETRKKLSEAAKGRVAPNKGVPMSDEQKAKLSAIHKGRVMSLESRKKMSESRTGAKNHNAKKVIQYDKQHNFVRVWDCIAEAARAVGINHHGIVDCCKGKQKTAGGFKWKYADKEEVTNVQNTCI